MKLTVGQGAATVVRSAVIVIASFTSVGGRVAASDQTQPAGITRTDVVRSDLDVAGREAVQVRVDFAPGVAFGRHSHPGAEIAYVLEGTLEYVLDGRAPVRLVAGQALFIPAGAVHSAKNVGSGNAAELATYIVEKGKPLVVPAKLTAAFGDARHE